MADLVRQLPPYLSTRVSARLLGVLFALIAVVGWIAVGFDIAEIHRLGQIAGGDTIPPLQRDAHYLVNSVLFAAQTTLFVAAAIGFLAWLHRARVNVRAFGMRRFEYAREWTILGFLVPLLNAVRPYQVVREVWQASDPSSLDPFEWKLAESPTLVRAWWIFFVAFAVLEILAVGMGTSSGLAVRKLQLSAGIEMLANTSGAISAALAFLVVTRISHNQQEKWALLRQGSEEDA